MLIELRIRDYAVIEDLRAEFGPGLVALTGETGAGKSIVVGAISLLLGERASADVVRAGAKRARVEAVFDIRHLPDLRRRTEELGLDDPEGLLILRREVAREGRSRAWVNGSPSTATLLGELGQSLVDLHGQHEHQTLIRREAQQGILDAFAGAGSVAWEVHDAYRARAHLEQERSERQARLREIEGRRDFLDFQLEELENARVQEGEDERLRADLSRLEHLDELLRGTHGLAEVLYAGEDALSDRVRSARDELIKLARMDAALDEQAAALDDVFHKLAEAGRALGDYAAASEAEPGRLEQIRARLDLLYRLKRKYGPELSDVLATQAQVAHELDELAGSTVELGELDRKLADAAGRLHTSARELSKRRQAAAERLGREVTALLPALGLEGATFTVRLDPLEEPSAQGAERVEFNAALNAGFEARPLARIASGGELARVMLALKTVLADVDQIPTLIFDEVDAGIGGAVANAVGDKLLEVAGRHQVFVVTHLPQIASRAGEHLRVSKRVAERTTEAHLERLGGEARVTEIARMLGGDADSEVSREHARELLAGR
ncbi:MAG: DNA repair protein RecN [Gemmatimonadota bacterium]